MKKIMFCDRYGLTDAVLRKQKTMTRRMVVVPKELQEAEHLEIRMSKDKTYAYICTNFDKTGQWKEPVTRIKMPYAIGEEIAIAQAYKTDEVLTFNAYEQDGTKRKDGAKRHKEMLKSEGYHNKMYVKADYMPHRIRITDVRIERMNNIPDDDCSREGIIHVEWKQWLKQDLDDLSPQRYKTHDLWTLPKFEEEWLDSWADQSPDNITASTPRTCFIVLFAKLAKKQPKDMLKLNPWVYAYEFELIK